MHVCTEHGISLRDVPDLSSLLINSVPASNARYLDHYGVSTIFKSLGLLARE